MTDERLARQLHAADVPEAADPAFVEGLYAELAAELGFRGQVLERTSSRSQVRSLRPARMLIAAALLLLLAIGAAVAGAALLRPPPDLLDAVRDAGQLRIALTRGHPQVVLPGGSVEGFEVDVAREISERMGLAAELIVRDDDGSGGADAWDVAFTSSTSTAPDEATVVVADAFAWWPTRLVVRDDAPIRSMADLAGRRIGLVAGSGADHWLRDDADPTAAGWPAAPADPTLVASPGDLACLDALDAADVDACAVTDLVPADLAARPQLRELDDALPVQVRAAVLQTGEGDPQRLGAELQRILAELRADGILRDLSLRRFGIDVTVPPAR